MLSHNQQNTGNRPNPEIDPNLCLSDFLCPTAFVQGKDIPVQ